MNRYNNFTVNEGYISKYKIEEIFTQLQEDLTKSTPDNPYEYIANFFYKKSKSYNKNIKSGKNKKTLTLSNTNDDFKKSLGNHSISLDIGGSLCKVTVFGKTSSDNSINKQILKQLSELKDLLVNEYGAYGWTDEELSFSFKNGEFHFLKFKTCDILEVVNILCMNTMIKPNEKIYATGGGAYKYASELKKKFSIEIIKKDELNCLIKGLNFTLEYFNNECYYFKNPESIEDKKIEFFNIKNEIYPYILVNIGSGVSILKVDANHKFERVSGTSIGGGTYFGLCRLITKISDYNELTKLSYTGNSNNVNMLVSDIYGGDYEQYNLKGSVTASSFGKAANKKNPWENVSIGDISLSLVNMIGINIAHLAHFSALKYDIKRILFAGNFLRKNPLTQNAIAFSVNYWSKGNMRALFLEHEGYFGSIGAFLSV